MRPRGSPNPFLDRVRTVGYSSTCTPSRGDSLESIRTNIREKRWKRDIAAFRRLHAEGNAPPQIDGSALRERQGNDTYDIMTRPVTIDYNDPT